MATDLIQNNFTAGEISPKMYGRSDINRYNNGLRQLENMLPEIQGGAKSTSGWRFVEEVKDSTKEVRLIRFEFSQTESMIIEIGDLYMRFYDQDGTQVQDGGSPFEIVTIFTEAQLFEIEFTASADTIFFFHENIFPQRLQRIDRDRPS